MIRDPHLHAYDWALWDGKLVVRMYRGHWRFVHDCQYLRDDPFAPTPEREALWVLLHLEGTHELVP